MMFGLGKNKDKDETRKSSANANVKADIMAVAGKGRVRMKAKLRSATALNGGVNKLFHGVAVQPRGKACCQAVESLGAQRFLSDEAPLLPLAECSNPQGCRCVYEHFDERRDNLRREADVGMPIRMHAEEKRDGRGRRITDG